MQDLGRFLWLALGIALGVGGTVLWLTGAKPAYANNDRYEDYVLCTGACSVMPKVQTDGVWLLDYRAGKLLGTIIDKAQGKITGWAEVDLVTEFGLPPRTNVHFLMTTGKISGTQAALYVAETTSGKFGV